ncbi:MAG: hypothetical protein IPK16_19370 [Anaerolineales bacterium]|nr:hypothetical protein [Anaerolineales bacterium]
MTQLQSDSALRLGRVGGLELSAERSAAWSMAALWISLSAIGVWLLGFGMWEAILGGLLAVVVHWVSDFLHQYGHAIAARRTGIR